MTEDQLRNLFSGYSLTRMKDRDEDPPITAAHRAFGQLWLKEGPTAVLSSKSIYNDVLNRIIPSQRIPVISGLWMKGFSFNNSGWFPYKPLDDTDWVVMINENDKDNLARNGFYLFSVKLENRLGQEES